MLKGCDTDSRLTDALCAALKATGHAAIGRYGKNLTAEEVDLCRKHGLGLWLICEVGAGGADRLSSANGISDAKAIVQQATALGAPEGTTLFAANFDFDVLAANLPAARAYMTGFMNTVHAYGFKGQMYADGLAQENIATDGGGYIPGAAAFAGSADYVANAKAALVQHPTITIAGVGVDPVDIYDESVIWYPGGAPVAPPAASSPATFTMPDLRLVQAALGVTVDGIFGPETAAAIAAYYAA